MMNLQNKKWWKIFVFLWGLVFFYLILMNSGIFPLEVKYDTTKESPFISNLWPSAAYEIQENGLLIKDSLYLDLSLNTNFEDLLVFVDGIAFADTDIKLVLKENFDAGPIAVQELQMNDWNRLDLSAVGPEALLVFSLENGESYQINELILKFQSPKWLNRFK